MAAPNVISMATPSVILLDGPMGTELSARGAATPPPLWSAQALVEAPEVVLAIHRDYAAAGATVHTAATFRTRRRAAGTGWAELATRAVDLARLAVPLDHRVAGSLAPLEDCYRPDLSPRDPRPEHRELARHLAGAGVDLLLCETFPHVGEALVCAEEALATGLETWVSFTAGHAGDLLTPAQMAEGAREAARLGAAVVLVNCTPALHVLPFVEALSRAVAGNARVGVYANGGDPADGLGWGAPDAPRRYADLAEGWVRAGATVVGGCCGTGPAHIAELARRLHVGPG